MPRYDANYSVDRERPSSVSSTFFTSVWKCDNVHEIFSFHPFFYRESVDEIVLLLTIQIKATEQYYSVVLHAYLAVQGAASFQVCG